MVADKAPELELLRSLHPTHYHQPGLGWAAQTEVNVSPAPDSSPAPPSHPNTVSSGFRNSGWQRPLNQTLLSTNGPSQTLG